MRILLLHNYYQEAGGEDVVVRQEMALLQQKGHDVHLFSKDNHAIDGFWPRVKAGVKVSYSRESRLQVGQVIARFHPDVVHVHNFFPLLSPSVYKACRRAKIPIIQTLHNFRVICPSALLFRKGKPCESCIGKTFPWPGVVHACYRRSYSGSAALASMIFSHRLLGTWSADVDGYIALTEFSRRKFINGGLPKERMFIKPNFVLKDPEPGSRQEGYAIFVGRLSWEKGIRLLMLASSQILGGKVKIIGDGPLRSEVVADKNLNVEYLGPQSEATVLDLMGRAAFFIFPSECYEGFPRVIVEAFAKGLPVLASRLGGAEELVADGKTGLLFNPGDAADLAAKAEWMFSHPEELKHMSLEARAEYQTKYTADRNYDRLMHIYHTVLKNGWRTPQADVVVAGRR